MSESFKSVAQGVPEIFEEVYLGGGGGAQCAPPGWDRVKMASVVRLDSPSAVPARQIHPAKRSRRAQGERARGPTGPGDETRKSKIYRVGAPAEGEGKGRSYESPLHGCLPRADAGAYTGGVHRCQ